MAQKLCAAYPWTVHPLIISAPMRVMSGPKLAVAVSEAGGLGFIGPNVKTADMRADLEDAWDRVRRSRLAVDNDSVLPVGVGFQLWSDEPEVAFAAVERYRPCAAWLYAPPHGQSDVDAWTRQIRRVSPATKVWVQIGTIHEAYEILASRQRPDVVVVQGSEAGGHGRATDGSSLMTLLPEMASVFASEEEEEGIPLVAAGGIANGAGVAAALCLGAAGVAMGTRFLASTEARIAKGYQDEVVRARDGGVSTTRTTLYNRLRGTVGWPDCYSPRTIVNRSWLDHQAGVPFAQLKAQHDAAAATAADAGWGPDGRLATYAGANVGLINEVMDARQIVEESRRGAASLLAKP